MRRLRAYLLVTLGAIVGVAIAVFVYDNDAPVIVEFALWETVPLPLWFVVAASAAVGAVLPWLLAAGGAWDRFRRGRQLRQRVRELEEEVVRLRNIPLQALPEGGEAEAVADEPAARPVAPPRPARRLEPLDDGEEGADAYDMFLAEGVGFDAVEAETYRPRVRALPAPDPEAADPYAVAFDAEDPAVADLEEAELYPAVLDKSRRGES